MTSYTLGFSLVIFGITTLFTFPTWKKSFNKLKGNERLTVIAWVLIFVGQGQMFAQKEAAVGISTLGTGAYYQVTWMALGSLFMLIALISGKVNTKHCSIAIIGLLLYGVVGLGGSAFSPSPSLSIYKSLQIIMDVALLVTALSFIKNPRLLINLSYFLLILILVSSAMGGFLWPELNFQNIYGAYTGVLHSHYPQVHANELGLLAAIILIASVRRTFEKGLKYQRYYWGSVAILAITVLYHAQARTSLASATIAIFIMAIFIPRMRPFTVLLTIGLGSFLTLQWLNGGINLNIEGSTVETYLRRGASDEQISSLSGRTELWRIGWKMFIDSPVFGHGMDAGVRYGGRLYGLPAGTNMHSSHFQILANMGFLGYLSWLIFVLAVTASLWKGVWNSPNSLRSEEGRFRLELILVASVILFRTFLGHVLVTNSFSLLVFIALFVSILASRNVQKSSKLVI